MSYNLGEDYRITPQEAALDVRLSFDAYYKKQKALLNRRRKDLAVLNSRAGISVNRVPTSSNRALAETLKIVSEQET